MVLHETRGRFVFVIFYFFFRSLTHSLSMPTNQRQWSEAHKSQQTYDRNTYSADGTMLLNICFLFHRQQYVPHFFFLFRLFGGGGGSNGRKLTVNECKRTEKSDGSSSSSSHKIMNAECFGPFGSCICCCD